MTTQNLNLNPRLTRALLQQASPAIDSFTVLDVGCSGGFHPLFHQFGEQRLKAVGFDPVVSEIKRLNAENKNPNLKYEAAYVGADNYAELFPQTARDTAPNTDFFGRTSAARAMRLSRPPEQAFGEVQERKLADKKIALDDYCAGHGIEKVDFIKIDTDGSDYEVLNGADKLLTNGVLGVSVEAQLHGAVHPHSNLFSNIDRFMRARGFALFDLDVFRYSRQVLPLPFYYNIPAQTFGGAVSWGEAVYFRDLADLNYEKHWKAKFTPADILKLACLYDLFGMPDCAAELMLNRPDAFAAEKREEYLNLLVPPMITGTLSYREFTGVFDMHPEFWYPKSGLFGKR